MNKKLEGVDVSIYWLTKKMGFVEAECDHCVDDTYWRDDDCDKLTLNKSFKHPSHDNLGQYPNGVDHLTVSMKPNSQGKWTYYLYWWHDPSITVTTSKFSEIINVLECVVHLNSSKEE